MLTDYTALFELLQLSVGSRSTLEHAPAGEDAWKVLLHEARKQRLLGVTFPAIKVLFERTDIPFAVYLSWEKAAGQIAQANASYRVAAGKVYACFQENGFRGCILKGVASAAYYPDPMLRQSGDIDIWVEGKRDVILAFLRNNYSVMKTRYIHTELKMFNGPKVEVHFTPSWMFSPFANRRLQRWFSRQAPWQFSHVDEDLGVCVPTLDFNGSYMLLHIYRHLLEEGIGLRQILDYYYLLQKMDAPCRESVCRDLRQLGLLRFAAALMYVLEQVFGMERRMMLCSPDHRLGRILLESILESGNFGMEDPVFASRKSRTEGILAHGWRKIRRDVRFLSLCPSEILWMPFFLLWQYFWRRRHGYLYKGR